MPSLLSNLSSEELLKFTLRILTAFDLVESHDDLWWRTDEPDYNPVTFFVTCNDLFYWASADTEEITTDNIDLLESTFFQINKLDEKEQEEYKARKDISKTTIPRIYAPILFCCRSRKMRPQGAYYKSIPKPLHLLFDACGPERDPKEPGNTYKPKD